MEQNKEFERIKAVRDLVSNRINRTDCFKRIKRGGFGKSRFDQCVWISVLNSGDEYEAASILFFEDFRLDDNSFNLHPGRYGYVLFQKWHNYPRKRPAPNIRIRINGHSGVFIPTGQECRKETEINVLDENETEEEIADKVFESFVAFTGFETNKRKE